MRKDQYAAYSKDVLRIYRGNVMEKRSLKTEQIHSANNAGKRKFRRAQLLTAVSVIGLMLGMTMPSATAHEDMFINIKTKDRSDKKGGHHPSSVAGPSNGSNSTNAQPSMAIKSEGVPEHTATHTHKKSK